MNGSNALNNTLEDQTNVNTDTPPEVDSENDSNLTKLVTVFHDEEDDNSSDEIVSKDESLPEIFLVDIPSIPPSSSIRETFEV